MRASSGLLANVLELAHDAARKERPTRAGIVSRIGLLHVFQGLFEGFERAPVAVFFAEVLPLDFINRGLGLASVGIHLVEQLALGFLPDGPFFGPSSLMDARVVNQAVP